MAQINEKPHLITVTMATATLQDDGTYDEDGKDVIVEGAKSLDERRFKEEMIEAALLEAKQGVRDNMREMMSQGAASGVDPKDIDWKALREGVKKGKK